MQVSVHFYSYFKDLAGCDQITITAVEGVTLKGLVEELSTRFPKWGAMQKCALIAVGVEYQGRDYILKPGDEVSVFPPVQGG
jgi:molybdopterin converting factor small subunit